MYFRGRPAQKKQGAHAESSYVGWLVFCVAVTFLSAAPVIRAEETTAEVESELASADPAEIEESTELDPAEANEIAEDSETIEGAVSPDRDRIVVTARKRNEFLQVIPLSVTAFDQTRLEDMGAVEFHDYARQVPGLSFVDRGAGRNDIHIRGISPLVGASAVGIYIDGISAASNSNNPDLNLYDIKTVQVLRGPQGTLYGEGALGGAILIETNAPDLSERAFDIDTRYLNQGRATSSNRHGYVVNAMVNIPLVEDRLGLRVVAGVKDRPGFIDWIETTNEAVPIRTHHDQNYEESWNARVALRFNATEDLTVTARYTHQDLEFGNDNSIGNGSFGKYVFASPIAQPGEDTIDQVSLDIDWHFPWFTLNWVTGLHDRGQEFLVNASLGQHGVLGDRRGGRCGPLEFGLDGEGTTISTEARLSNVTDTRFGALDWVAGVYYKDQSQKNSGEQVIADPGGPYDIHVLDFDVDFRSKSVALFADAIWDAREDLHFTLGLRYLRDTVESPTKTRTGFTLAGSGVIIPGSEGIFGSGEFGDFTRGKENVYEAFTPKFGVSYDVTDDAMIFANVAQGFRTGGINIGAARNLTTGEEDPPDFDPDTAWSYELGIKSSWWESQLIVNLTGFVIIWDDIQAEVGGVGPAVTRNLGEARSAGFELEFEGRPIEGLTLRSSVSFVDSRITEDVFVDDPDINANNNVKSGNTLQAPPWQASFSAQYGFPITGGLDGFLFGSASYTDDTVSGPTNVDQDRKTDAYWIMNVRLGVEGEGWGLYVYANNLLSEYAVVETDILQTYIIRPRMIGVNFRMGFSGAELSVPEFMGGGR